MSAFFSSTSLPKEAISFIGSDLRSPTRIQTTGAGATALSCGVRTKNRFLATYWFDPSGKVMQPRIITEVAQAHGMKTGIVTSDSTAGATK